VLNIFNIERNNYVNGNGCRYVIWVQGCKFNCKDCWNKQTWDNRIENFKSIDNIITDILSSKDIQGVTFTGGEPLLQATQLYNLAKLIKENTKLDIQIFTGFEINEEKSYFQKELLNIADTIIFGRFDKSKPNNNQVVVNNSSNEWLFNNSDVEIEIDENMNLVITGYPTDKLINKLKEI